MHVDVSVFHAKLLHLDVCPSIYHTSLKEWYVLRRIYTKHTRSYIERITINMVKIYATRILVAENDRWISIELKVDPKMRY